MDTKLYLSDNSSSYPNIYVRKDMPASALATLPFEHLTGSCKSDTDWEISLRWTVRYMDGIPFTNLLATGSQLACLSVGQLMDSCWDE